MTCAIRDEELAALAARDLPEARAQELRAHVAGCRACAGRFAALQLLDAELRRVGRFEAPAGAVLRARRAAAAAIGQRTLAEIMTPHEVAEFLRIEHDDVGEVLAEVPAFEVAGKVRVRRDRLLAWIGERERMYARQTLQSEVAGILTGLG
jgi:anti-sigma factor RsiW